MKGENPELPTIGTEKIAYSDFSGIGLEMGTEIRTNIVLILRLKLPKSLIFMRCEK